MNRIAIICAAVFIAGCASAPSRNDPSRPAATREWRDYEPAAASALAFSSPIAPPYPLLGLDRGAREPGAFIGFQDSVTEAFVIGVYDQQSTDPYQDVYLRSSGSEKVGVRYR